ncbi:MAG: VanZ family protein [Planctomycetes bacterium]|nr:VanZ family protein [Planctomycetota bacterium]
MTRLNKFRTASVVFALGIGLIVYAADKGLAKPVFDAVRALPAGDKISHCLLMGTLAALTNLAWSCRRLGSRDWSPGIGTLVVIVIVVAEEISQIWIPGRTFEWLDLTADAVGIALGQWIALRIWRRG